MTVNRDSKGIFIAFEGIDASGKATQSKMLAELLHAKLYSFPDYETPTGKVIKEHLQRKWAVRRLRELDTSDDKLDALVFQSIMLANRMEHALSITWFLQEGGHVVADRYGASGIVYGGSDGLDPRYLEELHQYLPQPDIYFLLDIPAEESFRRRPNRGGDRYEESQAKMEAVASRYRSLFEAKAKSRTSPSKWIRLDGMHTPTELHIEICNHLAEHFPLIMGR